MYKNQSRTLRWSKERKPLLIAHLEMTKRKTFIDHSPWDDQKKENLVLFMKFKRTHSYDDNLGKHLLIFYGDRDDQKKETLFYLWDWNGHFHTVIIYVDIFYSWNWNGPSHMVIIYVDIFRGARNDLKKETLLYSWNWNGHFHMFCDHVFTSNSKLVE